MPTTTEYTRIEPPRRRRSVRRGVLLLTLCMVAGGLFATHPAAAAPPPKACERATADLVSAHIRGAKLRGLSQNRIDEELQQKWCLERIDNHSGDVSPLSSDSAFDWYNQAMYRDHPNEWYFAVATWKWLNNSFRQDVGWSDACNEKNIGGRDGLSIRLSGGEYWIRGFGWGTWGDPALNDYPDDLDGATLSLSMANQYGIGFLGQDRTKRVGRPAEYQGNPPTRVCPAVKSTDKFDLTLYGGVITVTFNVLNGGCRNAQMFTDYAHTWDKTVLNSIGASIDGFSVGWVTTQHEWERPEPGPMAMVC